MIKKCFVFFMGAGVLFGLSACGLISNPYEDTEPQILGSEGGNQGTAESEGEKSETPEEALSDAEASGSEAEASEIPVYSVPYSQTACSSDTDCVLVPLSCCLCDKGGISIAIHKQEKQTYMEERKQRCDKRKLITCPVWPRCGHVSAKCINSLCVTEQQTSP